MKALIVTGVLCAAIGAAIGWIIASDHYEAKASREQDAYSKTLTEVNQRVELEFSEQFLVEPKNPIHSFAGVS